MKQTNKLQRIIITMAIFSLAAALTASYLLPDKSILSTLNTALPEAKFFNKISSNPLIYAGFADSSQQEKVGYAAVSQARGYGGPLTMVTGINLQGEVVEVVIAEHKDTPTFIQTVLSHDFLKQFQGKKINAPLSLDKDIDRVSGATLSSKGITKAVAQGSHAVAKSIFAIEVTEEAVPANFGIKELIVIALLVLMLVGTHFKFAQLRWVTLLSSLLFIGFKFNTAVSIGSIAGIIMGYFPPFKENVFWYLWFLGIPLITFLLGKNVYCFWLCPFGAVQEITAKISGAKFHCNKDIDAKAKTIKYVLTYLALLIAFLWRSPGQGSYEPFAALFAFKGYGVQWFILPIVLFASLFISRFWCNYFCPVGVANELTWKLRRALEVWLTQVKHKLNKKEAAGG